MAQAVSNGTWTQILGLVAGRLEQPVRIRALTNVGWVNGPALTEEMSGLSLDEFIAGMAAVDQRLGLARSTHQGRHDLHRRRRDRNRR